MYSLWQDLSVDTKIFDFVTLTLTFDLLLKNLTLAIIFEPKEIGLSYFTCVFLVTRPFCRYQRFWLRDLDLDFWPTFEKLNLGNNFWTKRDRAFIFHMCISCGKTFLLETQFFLPRDLDLDFWPTFEKKLNLDHNFWTKSDRALIYTHIYSLWQNLSVDTNIFDLVALTLTLTYLCKTWIGCRGGISPVRTDPDLVRISSAHHCRRSGKLRIGF